MDLYPFFPPLVKVIRPRLQGSMMLRVTTMEILKLSYWNPARDMKSVICDIKTFVQTWARLDLSSERNDRVRYPDGAYIDIEHHLLRLALVSEIVPRANKKYVVTTPKQELPPSAMEATPTASSSRKSGSGSGSKKSPSQQNDKKSKGFTLFGINKKDKEEKKKSGSSSQSTTKNMAKGVGYSSYQQKGWDVKAYMAAQKEKDRQIEIVLAKIYQELKKLHGSQQTGQRNLPDLIDGAVASSNSIANDVDSRRGSRRKRKHSPDEIINANNETDDGNSDDFDESTSSPPAIDPLSDLYAVLEGSALVPFLESKLQANSFLEICSHTCVYKCVVSIIREVGKEL